MILKAGADQQSIATLAETLKTEHPHLKEILDVHEVLSLYQESAYSSLMDSEKPFDRETLVKRAESGDPLMTLAEVPIDWTRSFKLFQDMIQACLDQSFPVFGDHREALKQMASDTEGYRAAMDEAVSGKNPDASITGGESGSAGSDPATGFLRFFGISSITPWFINYAETIASVLDGRSLSEQGSCPVCGNHPVCSVLDDTGARLLFCSVCRHQWSAPRIFCPFCKNQDADSLGYVTVDDDEKLRADVCDACSRSLPVFDLRKYQRDLYLPLELLTALPMNMNLVDQGYTV